MREYTYRGKPHLFLYNGHWYVGSQHFHRLCLDWDDACNLAIHLWRYK